MTKTAKKESYFAHADEASKPVTERRTVASSRGGTQVIRRHHLLPDRQDKILAEMEESGHFVSPFKRYGAYDGLVMSLARLGENETHMLGDVLREFEAYMSAEESKDGRSRTAWEKFKGKKPRSESTGLDYVAKVRQNANVLQRMGGAHPYALKLAQLGSCVDILRGEDGAFSLRLRTGIPSGAAITPLNEFKQRECSRSVDSIPSRIRFSGSSSGGSIVSG